ncbi:MAG: hypothetical protein J0M10_16510 [Chitinophagales bacterium]|nr:hypothetical protein [Chitinophagales bacterium]
MPYSLLPIKISPKEEVPLEIYVKFTKLDNSTLLKLLLGIDKISRAIIREYSLTDELTNLAGSNIKISPELEISSINTGNSIIWKYKEGWKPTFRPNQHGDLEISINYKIGLTALIASSLLFAIPRVLDVQKTYLENKNLEEEIKIKKIDRQIKEQELESKTSAKESDIHKAVPYKESSTVRFVPTVDDNKEHTEKEINNYLLYIQNNRRITFVQINGVVIKNSKPN